MRINTLRFRISVVYVAIIGLILILFQGVLFINYVDSVSKEFDSQLQIKAEQIGGAVNTFRRMLGEQKQAFQLASQQALDLSIEYPEYDFMSESPKKFWLADAKKLGLDNDYLVIMGRRGNVIAKSRNVNKALLSYFKNEGRLDVNENRFYKVNVGKDALRVVIMPYFYSYNQGYIIAVGSSYGLIQNILWQHFLFILFTTFLFLVIASLLVRIFVISVLSSVLEISNVARNITQENLSARIKLTDTDEEIEHLTLSLNEMIVRLEKSFAHVKEFSLEMAHEVKTPLAIISGESQLVLEKDRTIEEYKETFNLVLKESKRTQKFVSDLLLLTKLDYRLIEIRFESINLTEFIREICERMRVISSSKGILIECVSSHESMYLRGDKVHLQRVFFNLIDNGLRFTPQGGRIEVFVKRNDQKAIVLVSDSGPGIAPGDLSKVFNKFYRVDESSQGSAPGCGLGLSIVYSIIKLHRGNITVNSELGKGTTFKIEFPLV